MELKHTYETWGGTDNRWLGSSEGTESVQSIMLDLTDSNWVPATHWPKGYLLSGLPLKLKTGTEGRYRLWLSADGRADGFLLWGGQKVPSPTNDDVAAEMISVGFVRLPYLPVTMTAAQVPALFVSVYAAG